VTHAQIRDTINAVLGAVPFEPPVDVMYCGALRDALRPALPDASIDVFHRFVELTVDIVTPTAHVRVVTPLV
jgi:hypothetical protein